MRKTWKQKEIKETKRSKCYYYFSKVGKGSIVDKNRKVLVIEVT